MINLKKCSVSLLILLLLLSCGASKKNKTVSKFNKVESLISDSISKKNISTNIKEDYIFNWSDFDLSIITNSTDTAYRNIILKDDKGNVSNITIKGGDSLKLSHISANKEKSNEVKQYSTVFEKINKNENRQEKIIKKDKEVERKPLPFWYFGGIIILIFVVYRIWNKLKSERIF